MHKRLVVKFNTPVLSSAAVERLLSVEEDVLRPKRAEEHFQMIVFFKEKLEEVSTSNFDIRHGSFFFRRKKLVL